MSWKLYSLDQKPVNYDDLSKNKEIATIEIKPEISNNLKIGDKIYNVGMLDFKSNYAGVHEIEFIPADLIDETIEEDFTCPYCGYVYHDAFELSDKGEYNCPSCNSELKYTRQVTVEYIVEPIKQAKIRKIS